MWELKISQYALLALHLNNFKISTGLGQHSFVPQIDTRQEGVNWQSAQETKLNYRFWMLLKYRSQACETKMLGQIQCFSVLLQRELQIDLS